MINLIPAPARKKVLTEYWIRASSVWLLIFSIACLVVSVLLLPVYVLVNSQIDVYSSSVNEASSKIVEFDASASTITTANNKAQKLFELRQVKQFSDVAATLESLHGQEIVVDGLEFKRQGMILGSVSINGFANNRQSLANFKEALLTLPDVAEVNLPISNLAKDKDIKFAITVTFKDVKK